MSDLTPGPDHAAVPERADFFARSKKALAGGAAGAVTGVGTAFSSAIADGTISEGDAWLIAGAAVGGFVVGFTGVWVAPKNQV